MSDVLKRAIQHAVSRTEPRRLAAIHMKTPGALEHPDPNAAPSSPQPLVTDWEIRQKGFAEAEYMKTQNLPVSPMEIEQRVRTWLRTEEQRRLQAHLDRIDRGNAPQDT